LPSLRSTVVLEEPVIVTSSTKLMQLGGVLSGLAVTATVAYWIYTLEADGQVFWTLYGVLGVVGTISGLSILIWGFFKKEKEEIPSQRQSGGIRSTNYQAGRDMAIGRDVRNDS